MKTHQKLARAFKALAEQGEQIDSTASSMLALVKDAGAVNDEKFDALVAEAYEVNGWNAQVGRPTNGAAQKEAAPNTVRVYVSIMRRAIRAGLRIGRYKTFTALRVALEENVRPRVVPARKGRKNGRKAAQAADVVSIPKSLESDFKGVEITQAEEFNLSLFHDLPILFVKLPKDQRELFRRQLEKLVNQYKGRVAALIPERKAA